jgi:hypothetical protein
MLNLALWLKKNNFRWTRCRPSCPRRWPWPRPCTTRKNPAQGHGGLGSGGNGPQRQDPPHAQAFLRYQDPANWPILREALVNMGRGDLIGNGDKHLIPAWTSSESGGLAAGERSRQTHGAGTPDKFKVAPGKSRIALGGTAAAPKATAVESKVRPSILSTIKTKAKPAAAPVGRGAKPAAKGGTPARSGRR